MNFIISASLGMLNLLFFVLSPILQAVLNKAELNTIHLITFALMALYVLLGAVAHMRVRLESPDNPGTINQILLLAGGVPASSILLVIAVSRYLGYLHHLDAGILSLAPALVFAITAVWQAGFIFNDMVAVAQKWQLSRGEPAAAAATSSVAATGTVDSQSTDAESVSLTPIVDAEISGKNIALANSYEDVRSSAGILESVTQKFGSEREEEAKAFAKQVVALYVEQFESDKLTNESARITFENGIDYTIILRAEKILRARGWRMSMIDQQSFILGPCVPADVDGFAGVFSI
jgi:hypothetical protein